MPVETPEQFKLILNFPFEGFERYLLENYDLNQSKAKQGFDFLREHDPVLFEAMLKWGHDHEEKWGLHSNRSAVISGVMLCYDFLKQKAGARGEQLPSFTALGKQPDPHVDTAEDRHRVAQVMGTADPELVRFLGEVVFVLRAFEFKVNPGANDPINPGGSFLVQAALKCYDAFRAICPLAT